LIGSDKVSYSVFQFAYTILIMLISETHNALKPIAPANPES